MGSRTSRELRCELRWKAACGLGLHDTAFDPSLLTYFRRRLQRSGDPGRLFAKVKEVVAATGVIKGRQRRALDSTVLDDAVATQDTVTPLVAAIRRVILRSPAPSRQPPPGAPPTTTPTPASRRSRGMTSGPAPTWSTRWSPMHSTCWAACPSGSWARPQRTPVTAWAMPSAASGPSCSQVCRAPRKTCPSASRAKVSSHGSLASGPGYRRQIKVQASLQGSPLPGPGDLPRMRRTALPGRHGGPDRLSAWS